MPNRDCLASLARAPSSGYESTGGHEPIGLLRVYTHAIRRKGASLDQSRKPTRTGSRAPRCGRAWSEIAALSHPPQGANAQGKIAADPVTAERNAHMTEYKSSAKAKGIKVTDKMVAKAANDEWNDRTMVTWWKRNDPRCGPHHDKMIRAVLAKDPASIRSIWS